MKKIINQKAYPILPQKVEVGGLNEECYIEPYEGTTVDYPLTRRGLMGTWTVENVKQELEHHTYIPPYTIDPRITTFQDLENHAILRQNLAETTAEKRMNLLRLMETESPFKVDFRYPHWSQFFVYMDYLKSQGYSYHQLNNRRKAWNMATRAWGFDKIWPSYPIKQTNRGKLRADLRLPSPETIHEVLHHKYVNSKDLNRLIQYHFFFGFMIGMRPPSEMVVLNVDDLYIDEPGHYALNITMPKLGNRHLMMKLENWLVDGKTTKSIRNYVDHVLPKFQARDEDALFVNPSTGRRWKKESLRLTCLSKYGKQVIPYFYPYLMRHWCCTARCIEWRKDSSMSMRITKYFGHSSMDMTMNYIHQMHFHEESNDSWLRRALKHRRGGGKHENSQRPNNLKKTIYSAKTTDRDNRNSCRSVFNLPYIKLLPKQ